MESLSSVGTIVRIAQDIAGAVATVSRNRDRCRQVAERVQRIDDLLRELHGSEAAGAGTTDAATRRLLGRLEDALRRALQLVLSCRDSSCPLSLLSGGRQAERLDEVNGEIDRCLLDLAGVANLIKIARIERLMLRDPASCSTETVTIRVGMPCDDSADHIKRCIHTMRGVTDVAAAAASTKDQFRVTVRSGDVDIPSLLEQVKEKLNRNVELVTPVSRKVTGGGGGGGAVRSDDFKDEKANRGVAEKGGDKQRHCGCASGGDEIKKENSAAMTAAAANNTGTNHGPAPYAYLPFAVALVPIATEASMYQEPSLPYNFLPRPQGPPGNAQPYRHRVPTPAKKYNGAGDRKDTGVKDDCTKDDDNKTEKFAAERGSDKKKELEPTGGGETKDRDKTAAGVSVTIGVPVHTVNAGKHELVPPPSYGYGHGAGTASDAAAYHHHNYSPYRDMFSDENPNACAII